ncbi:hypothetical protein ACOKFD_17955 [Flagellimonas sp. S174]|uniref:hypothetical protein n=1 Tax=Flagellimonas sp. S174 TaxID=3410790 RepID=UPI003BF5D9DE
MDYRLRTRHKWMWMILTPTLAILLFLSGKNLDFFSSSENLYMAEVKGNVVEEIENAEIKVVLSNTSEQYLLNIWLKSPLRATSSVVYEINGKGEKGAVLGQLQGIGNYSFPSTGIIKGFIVMDEIKNQQILKLEF